MIKKTRILYIEDMEKCHELTRQALGDEYDITSIYTPEKAISEIKSNTNKYDALISDVNLNYNSSRPDNEQTKEGLELIALARKESKTRGMKKLPIFCISSDGSHRKPSLKNGANIFMWKKQFWGSKGKKYLDRIIQRRYEIGLQNQSDIWKSENREYGILPEEHSLQIRQNSKKLKSENVGRVKTKGESFPVRVFLLKKTLKD
jgi:CheY-like chemotaxis protein